MHIGDITPQLIDEYMNIEDAPETEMLTRTSGEARLSDFILWQSDFAMLYFEPKNMPEVGLLDYVKAIIHYQILCQFDRVSFIISIEHHQCTCEVIKKQVSRNTILANSTAFQYQYRVKESTFKVSAQADWRVS